MTNQQIKIEFDTTPRLKIGDICSFISTDNTTSFKAIYIANSRIDGYPMFMIQHMPIKQFTDYKLKGHPIRNVSLIKQLEDNIANYNNFISENKEKIINYLFELYDIKESDLKEKDAYKSIIRNIKLKTII